MKLINQDILNKIYEYDNTYHLKYKRIINFINLLPKMIEISEEDNYIKIKSNLFFLRSRHKNYRTHKQLLVVSPDMRSTDFFPYQQYYKHYFRAILQTEKYFKCKREIKYNF